VPEESSAPFGPGTANRAARASSGDAVRWAPQTAFPTCKSGLREHSTYRVTPRPKVVFNGNHGQNLSLAHPAGGRPTGPSVPFSLPLG